jgi:hypothetical protein
VLVPRSAACYDVWFVICFVVASFFICNVTYKITRVPYHMMFVSFNMTGATNEKGIAYLSGAPGIILVSFRRFRVEQSLVFCVMCCRSLFVLFLWTLYCLPFFDLWFLINPLIFSHSSCPFPLDIVLSSLLRFMASD